MAINALIGTGLRSLGVGPGEDGLLDLKPSRSGGVRFRLSLSELLWAHGSSVTKIAAFITNLLYLAIAAQFIGALLVIPQTRHTLSFDSDHCLLGMLDVLGDAAMGTQGDMSMAS